MNYADGALSPSDVALLTNRNGNSGFGDGGWSAWILVFLIFAIFGWNGNGFGNRGNGGTGSNGNGSVMDNYVLASDFATLQRQLSDNFSDLTSQTRYIQNGLCNGFYNQAQLINGVNTNIAGTTAAIQQSLCQGFNGINQGLTTNGYETRNAIQGVSNQLANCCCSLEKGQMETNYLNAQNTCALQNTMNMNTRDIVDTVNANYRALHDEIVANRIEDKNAQIQAQQNEINALRLSQSQTAQNEYLLNQLRNGCPVNAQLVCGNTPIPVQYIGAGCGCNCGCGSC